MNIFIICFAKSYFNILYNQFNQFCFYFANDLQLSVKFATKVLGERPYVASTFLVNFRVNGGNFCPIVAKYIGDICKTRE